MEPPVSTSIFGLAKVISLKSLKKFDTFKLSEKSRNGSFKARKMPNYPVKAVLMSDKPATR